jgi:hypothetical protein
VEEELEALIISFCGKVVLALCYLIARGRTTVEAIRVFFLSVMSNHNFSGLLLVGGLRLSMMMMIMWIWSHL